MSSEAVNSSCSQKIIDYFKKEKVFGNRYTAIVFPLIFLIAFSIASVSLKTYHITHGQMLFNCILPVVILALGCSAIKVIFKENRKQAHELQKPGLSNKIKELTKRVMRSKEFIISSTLLLAASLVFLGLGIGNGVNRMSAFSQYLDHAASTAFKVTALVTLSFAVCLYWIGMHLKKFWKEHSKALMDQFDCFKQPIVDLPNNHQIPRKVEMNEFLSDM